MSELHDLLQALEHAVEDSRRLSHVLRQFLEAQRDGRPMSDVLVREYLQQMDTGDVARQQIEDRIRQFWAQLGKEQAH